MMLVLSNSRLLPEQPSTDWTPYVSIKAGLLLRITNNLLFENDSHLKTIYVVQESPHLNLQKLKKKKR